MNNARLCPPDAIVAMMEIQEPWELRLCPLPGSSDLAFALVIDGEITTTRPLLGIDGKWGMTTSLTL